jgi:hypothetical protein
MNGNRGEWFRLTGASWVEAATPSSQISFDELQRNFARLLYAPLTLRE